MREAGRQARVVANRFERHPRTTTAVILAVMFGMIEIVAYFVVRMPGFYVEYNRKVSGYTVFQNNPKHRLVTQKRDEASPDVAVDEYGFISAAFTRAYHQSVLYYLEQVSRFSPDWVVSMDGYNDVNHLVSGTPYADRAEEIKYYINLDNAADCPQSAMPNTYCMLQGVVSRMMMKISQGRRLAPPAYTAGFHYIDMNRTIQRIPASVEFYTDYCHMTYEGNRLIAQAIGGQILAAR